MSKFYYFIILFIFIINNSCVSGDANIEQVCSKKEYATIPANIPIPTISFTRIETYDFSSYFDKIKNLGDISITLETAKLSSKENTSLSMFSHLVLSYIDVNENEHLIKTLANSSNSTITASLQDSPIDLQIALKTGPVKFKLSGIVASSKTNITPEFELCASVSQKVNISKL